MYVIKSETMQFSDAKGIVGGETDDGGAGAGEFLALAQALAEPQRAGPGGNIDAVVEARFQPDGKIESGEGGAGQGCEPEDRAADDHGDAPMLRRG